MAFHPFYQGRLGRRAGVKVTGERVRRGRTPFPDFVFFETEIIFSRHFISSYHYQRSDPYHAGGRRSPAAPVIPSGRRV
jgi:hypothetical protein